MWVQKSPQKIHRPWLHRMHPEPRQQAGLLAVEHHLDAVSTAAIPANRYYTTRATPLKTISINWTCTLEGALTSQTSLKPVLNRLPWLKYKLQAQLINVIIKTLAQVRFHVDWGDWSRSIFRLSYFAVKDGPLSLLCPWCLFHVRGSVAITLLHVALRDEQAVSCFHWIE
jgi:hypothetical protein